MTWAGIVGRAFTPESFLGYVTLLGLKAAAWKPYCIVLHNTGAPTLSQRPSGFSAQNMKDLEHFYRDTNGWSAGPHLFVDDKLIWAFTPLTHPGVHSPSWNAISWGVEMLGDYSVDDFRSGRGAAVAKNAVSAIASLCEARGWDPNTMDFLRLHHEDPKTTHRDCPGKTVAKAEVLASLRG